MKDNLGHMNNSEVSIYRNSSYRTCVSDRWESLPLIKACQERKREALGELYHRYDKRVYNLALRNTGSHEEALDIVQEVFYRIQKSITKFNLNRPFLPWLYSIAYRVCMNHLGERIDRKEISLDLLSESSEEDKGYQILDKGPDPAQVLERKELKERLDKHILFLTSEQKTLFTMRCEDSLSFREIAEVLNLSVGAVRTRLYRVKGILKKRLAKDFKE